MKTEITYDIIRVDSPRTGMGNESFYITVYIDTVVKSYVKWAVNGNELIFYKKHNRKKHTVSAKYIINHYRPITTGEIIIDIPIGIHDDDVLEYITNSIDKKLRLIGCDMDIANDKINKVIATDNMLKEKLSMINTLLGLSK